MQKFPTGKYLTVNFILWGMYEQVAHMITIANNRCRCRPLVLRRLQKLSWPCSLQIPLGSIRSSAQSWLDCHHLVLVED